VSTAGYYDEYREQLLLDYYGGNPRVEAALKFVETSLDGATSVLDIGSGIGWSSAEISEMGAKVTGIDISPVLVREAMHLFPHCRFEASDFSTWDSDETFDAVVMIDVYEHFSPEQRPAVHERIKRAQPKRVLLTVPTHASHAYSAKHGLQQPVDEDITDQQLEQLAADLGGRIVVNRTVTVWRPHDYRHVLIAIP